MSIRRSQCDEKETSHYALNISRSGEPPRCSHGNNEKTTIIGAHIKDNCPPQAIKNEGRKVSRYGTPIDVIDNFLGAIHYRVPRV